MRGWLTQVLLAVLLASLGAEVAAHGERAQLAGMRMRTVHWFDMEVSHTNVSVGDEITIRGKFVASEHWPNHLAGLDDAVYLNVGVPGPSFIRLESSINGVPMIRSTSLELGKVYEYRMRLKARVPGRYHLHPMLNVKDVGSIVGKGRWVEVAPAPGDEPFVNELQTMRGETIDLETYGLTTVKVWHAIWFVLGLAWLAYWLLRRELFIPRLNWVRQANENDENPDDIITRKEFLISGAFLTLTLAIILTGNLYTYAEYPTTIPLQTGKVKVVGDEIPIGSLEIDVQKASYKLGGRSLEIEMVAQNHGDHPVQISEFLTANIRFMNPRAPHTMPVGAGEEMVAATGLQVSANSIAPGESRLVKLLAADSLWESQRMTGLINDPDSRFAGLLFYSNDSGEMYYQEIGGPIVPSFF